MHPANQVPSGVPALQEFLYATFRLGQLNSKRRAEIVPQVPQHRSRNVLRAHRRRHSQSQPLHSSSAGASAFRQTAAT